MATTSHIQMSHRDAARERRRRGVKQEDLARELGMSRASLSDWENGKVPLPWKTTVAEVFEAIKKLATNPDLG